ncbi:4-carboxymuconolactone decarboxylase [Georgenia yuyongxinii]|uniref:4-carboxymuconolactone decarboxylase n=1 Tax=Georgenia yuyongxinii TaxID=2589797 RepID=A0A5B8BZT8_9MICO|nr:carboxymuconolactone decarboxylase family protein [Georgenia yuyongxinii]QDC23773.1 4-carboxymuconolactone decarboxylase [Georgenia yuyongxinii]
MTARPPVAQARADSHDRGLTVRTQVLGEDHVDRAFAGAVQPWESDLQEMVSSFAWGEVWARDELPRRERSLVTVAMLVALGRHEELAVHVRGGVRNGLEPSELGEVVVHAAVYCGFPAALTAMRVLTATLADVDGADGGQA